MGGDYSEQYNTAVVKSDDCIGWGGGGGGGVSGGGGGGGGGGGWEGAGHGEVAAYKSYRAIRVILFVQHDK